SGASVDMTGRGFAPGASYANTTASTGNAGGSHIGGGAPYTGSGDIPGATFGSIYHPQEGGGGAGNTPQGTGAGAVHLTGGTLTVDGVIRANGQGGTGSNDHSGGGGSIWINATNIAGSGTMEARGEDVTAGWAGGGGGAMSIEYTGTSSG